MAHDVNQSEMEVAAQVRSALVARISPERFELWVPADTRWDWQDGLLTLAFRRDFARQIANRMLLRDLREVLNEVAGPTAQIQLIMRAPAEEDSAVDKSPSVESRARVLQTSASIDQSLTSTCEPSTESYQHAPKPTLSLHGSTAATASDTDDACEVFTLSTSRIDRAARSPVGAKLVSDERNGDDVPAAESSRKAEAWGTFITGSSNQMAWTTASLILQEPGRMSPVLVHGPYGVGKSHLASAIAHGLRASRRQRRVLHITSEQFTNDFTEAIRGGGLPMLRRKYRDVDSLILDDLQFLVGKKATINELRHTLDNLLKAGRQVVFTADRSLNELEALGSDFTTRLRGGLVTPLLPLDEETRYRLLSRELSESQVEIADAMLRQISARSIGDGRLLKGISKRLVAAAYVHGDKLTWDQCWNAVFDLIQATQPVVRLGDIERVVCEVFGLEPQSLQSERKTRTVSQPRMLAMFLARKYTPAAYKEIGDFFGNRRHSTVISAEKTVETWLEQNASLSMPRGSLTVRDAMRHVEATLQVG
ncbi:MAG: DnaA/Hda family protein [Pirellulales bacterium]